MRDAFDSLRVDCAPGVSQTSSGQRSKQRACYTFICPITHGASRAPILHFNQI